MTLVLYPSRLIPGTSIYKQTTKVKHVDTKPEDTEDSMQLINTIKDRLGRGFVRI